MERSQWFEPKWKLLRKLRLLVLFALVPVAAAFALRQPAIAAIGMLFLLPVLFWLAFMPILHWRDRYRGSHPTVWGAFLAFETSGWSKLIYWFRHLLPDYKATGRYSDAP